MSKDIIIESLENAGYEIEINDGTIIVDDYDTNNGPPMKGMDYE